MKAKVIKTDESVIYQGVIYSFEDEFEIDDSIGKSLIERGYISGITDNGELFDEEEVITHEINLDEMSYPDLKAFAKDCGVSATGTKAELIEKIKEALAAQDETDEAEDSTEGDEIPDTSMPE